MSEATMRLGDGVEVLESAPRVSNRRLVQVGVAVVVVIALVLGTLTVVDVTLGGAATPASLGRRLVSTLDAGRPDKTLALVEPRERAAIVRTYAALDDDLTRLGLTDVLGGGTTDRDDPLRGLDIHLDDVRATTEQLSPDVAVLTFATGQVRLRADPASARGPLRVFLTRRRTNVPTDRTVPVASVAADRPGVRVLAVREHHRWYASALLTLIDRELGPEVTATRAVSMPTGSAGSKTPEAATSAAVRAAVSGYAGGDLGSMASTLDPIGAVAVGLWGHELAAAAPSDPVTVSDDAFVSTALDDNRALVQVRSLTLRSGSGSGTVRVSPTCVTVGDQRSCLQRSGYRYVGYAETSPFELLARDGAFALSAVRADPGWRLGLVDSVADAVAGWAGALTREQVLALLGRARLDVPSGSLTPDRPQAAAFTSAGYLLRRLQIEQAGLYRFVPSPDGYNRGAIYAANGEPALQKFYPNDDSYDLPAGDYTVLVWADDAFSDWLTGTQASPYRQRVEVRLVAAA